MKTEQEKHFSHDLIPLIDLDTINIEGRRYYVTPDGLYYPSVTTVTSSLKKSFIDDWKKRVGEEEAQRISRKAASRGTAMHALCEDYLSNKSNYRVGKMPHIIELFNKIKPIVDEHIEKIYGIELALFSRELKTAGRTDLFCQFMGMNTVLDFKTATKPKQEADIEDYFLQATTYAMMIEEMYCELKPIYIPQIAVVIAVEEAGAPGQLFIKQTHQYRGKVRKLFMEYHEKNPPPTVPGPGISSTTRSNELI